MKRLFLATVKTSTARYQGGDNQHATRTIPVYADDRHDVERLVREDLQGETSYGDIVTVLNVTIEDPIGLPDADDAPGHTKTTGMQLIPETHDGGVADAAEALRALTPEQRMEAMAGFCKHCGIEDNPDGTSCRCWDDS